MPNPDWPPLLDAMAVTDANPTDVAAATSRVRSYCDWHIAPAFTETVEVYGGPRGKWRVDTLNILSVTSVTDLDTGLLISDIRWDGGLVWSRYSQSRRRVSIVLSHGYEECPADVVDFVRQLAKSGPTAPSISQASVGQVNVSYREPSFAALDDYRLPQI